jgi:hypothetical protein
MSVYHGEDGIKKMIYDERKAFVDQMWERYKGTLDKNGNAGDYRILAELCEKLPFFENSEVGQEISRLLHKHSSSSNDYYTAQRYQRETKQILKLWDDFKRDDGRKKYDSVGFRRTIASIMGGAWNAASVHEIIKARNKKLGETY